MAEIEKFLSDDAEKQVKNLVKLMDQLAKSYETNFQMSKKLDDQLKSISKTTENTSKTKKKLTEIEREEARILAATEKTKAKLQLISTESNKLLVKEQQLLIAKNKELRAESKETGVLEGAFRKLNNRRAEAAKRLKDLVASEKASTREINKAQRAFDTLDKKVQKANRSARQFQSNVGNYPKLFASSTRALGGFLSAFGLVGGIQLFARSIQDAFNRIREFDKSIVELAAILGKSRKEIALIEKEIITVAGASKKTSSEVATLATALATLGATESEILNLIKPVNDLSIALKSTSEEAAELLKGTLNAFGESSNEALRYGDVIAKLRTSTALNFERIKDSLGFVAPTARAVGLDIEGLGARIGVLVDNNVKAARAGRLLNSSFLRLAKDGKTLETALDELNIAQGEGATQLEIGALAAELFGKEAAPLGIILANNRDRVAELTKELKDSQGTLEELTNAQLQSLDARLKILDSSFERFILTITKGDNFISNSFKFAIDDLSNSFTFLSNLLSGTDAKFERWKKTVRESNPSIERINLSIDNLNEKMLESQKIIDDSRKSQKFGPEFREARDNVENYNEQLNFLNELKELRERAAQDELDRIAEDERKKEEARKLAREKELDELRKHEKRKKEVLGEFTDIEEKDTDEIKDALVREIDEIASGITSKMKMQDDLNSYLDNLREDQLEKDKAASDERIRIEEEEGEKRKKIIESSIQLLTEIAQGFTDTKIQQYSDESTALELQRQTALDNVEGDKNKEEQINAEFDRKQAAIKQKQWKAEQNGALFQIAIQTGVNAVEAFPNPVLLGLAVALGLAQAAFVKAQKVPQFAKGSKGLAQDTYGEVGEAGRELLFMPGGGATLVEKPTKGLMPKGTVIKTNRETEQILAANQVKAQRENDVMMRDYSELRLLSETIADNEEKVLEAVENQNAYYFNMTVQGVEAWAKNKRGKTRYLDNRFR